MKIKIFYLAIILLMQNVYSQDGNSDIIFLEKNYEFPYHLSVPVKIQKLPSKLIEISGLSFIENERFACIQDEKGNIYVLNFETAEIEKKINFADDGDFEGMAIVGKTAWALKSSGDLYRVKNFIEGEETLRAKKFENALSKKNDAEGVAFDEINNRLLIACKGHPYIDNKRGKHKKAIYEFDLETKKLNPEPVFIIDLDQIKEFRNYNSMTQLGIDLLSSLDKNKGDVTFQPSGIAVHPVSGNIYVLGSVGDLLLVLNREGQTLAMVDLDDKLFNQPEGICFDKIGTLYIANEGGEGRATMLKFEMVK
ncbi:MAG: SdiA-regulated domain-containing protein [Bacteroidales bacterium]|nr:SdiA-regulated domain-containing protein [Bacteroidales bacterium]